MEDLCKIRGVIQQHGISPNENAGKLNAHSCSNLPLGSAVNICRPYTCKAIYSSHRFFSYLHKCLGKICSPPPAGRS